MKIKPLFDRILVRGDAAPKASKGGILMPDTAKEKPQRGEVLAVGLGGRTDKGDLIPMVLKVGDVILFTRYAGSEIREAGDDLLIMRESDVLGTVEL